MPRVSVLVPARNAAKTISQAVRSTLEGLPADAEIVVLDDASTDGTAQVLESIGDARVRVVREDVGLGVAGGLNRLLEVTDSEFVARMDGDDQSLPGRIAAQLRHHADGGTGVSFTVIVDWRPDAGLLRRWRPYPPLPLSTAAFPVHLLLGNPVAHPSMFGRRVALERVGGYRQVPAEDYDLWLRLAAAGVRMERTARPGLLYRVHAQQLSGSAQWRAASWADEDVASAYADLAEQLTGERLPRLVSLNNPARSEAEVAATIQRWSAALERAARGLSRRDAAILRTRVSARLRVAQQQRSALARNSAAPSGTR